MAAKPPAAGQRRLSIPKARTQVAFLLWARRRRENKVQGRKRRREISRRYLVRVAERFMDQNSPGKDRQGSRPERGAVPFHAGRHHPMLRAPQRGALTSIRA